MCLQPLVHLMSLSCVSDEVNNIGGFLAFCLLALSFMSLIISSAFPHPCCVIPVTASVSHLSPGSVCTSGLLCNAALVLRVCL